MTSSVTAQQAPIAGMVIAGGRSLRFGSEKASALLAGKPLLMWAVERLQRACTVVAVNARPETAAEALARAAGLAVLHDAPGDASGPLAGIRAGLTWAQARGAQVLAVSPCDAPLLPQDLFGRLLSSAGSGAAMAITPDGRQPLCSVWPIRALPVLDAALQGGAHPPTWALLEQLAAVPVRFADAAAFANLNTREDLTSLAARLAARP